MKYTAITIGPILKTLQSVKSTKAIWAASYMFSYLMREIIKTADVKQEDVILPFYTDKDIENTERLGVGLFPDRLIVKGNIPDLQKHITTVITEFAKKVNGNINKTEIDVIEYFNEYLTIYPIEIDIDNEELDEKDNIIFKINRHLDTAELKQKIVKNANADYLNSFLEDVYYNFFVVDEFIIDENTDKDNKRFPSTIEISNAELYDVDKNK